MSRHDLLLVAYEHESLDFFNTLPTPNLEFPFLDAHLWCVFLFFWRGLIQCIAPLYTGSVVRMQVISDSILHHNRRLAFETLISIRRTGEESYHYLPTYLQYLCTYRSGHF